MSHLRVTLMSHFAPAGTQNAAAQQGVTFETLSGPSLHMKRQALHLKRRALRLKHQNIKQRCICNAHSEEAPKKRLNDRLSCGPFRSQITLASIAKCYHSIGGPRAPAAARHGSKGALRVGAVSSSEEGTWCPFFMPQDLRKYNIVRGRCYFACITAGRRLPYPG